MFLSRGALAFHAKIIARRATPILTTVRWMSETETDQEAINAAREARK